MPLAYFNKGDLDWAAPLDRETLAFSFVVQTVAELVVDALSVVIAQRQGHRPTRWWRAAKARLVVIACVCAFFSTAIAHEGLEQDWLPPCRGRDMCYCAGGHGLAPQGLRQRYCDRLYSNTTSQPPGRPRTPIPDPSLR